MNRAGLAACLLLVGSAGVRHADALGDTRTISLHHVHTDESLTITFKKNGQYDEEALKKIDHELRDWRRDETIHMDPHLIDLVWEVHRDVGSSEPIWGVSAVCSRDMVSCVVKTNRGLQSEAILWIRSALLRMRGG